jgi:uncharacterized protein (UPF0335 family)
MSYVQLEQEFIEKTERLQLEISLLSSEIKKQRGFPGFGLVLTPL